MAQGTLRVFDEAFGYIQDGGWEAADVVKCLISKTTTTVTSTWTTPVSTDFTEVNSSGTYTAGGSSLGTWGGMITQSGAKATFDSTVNPTWAQSSNNSSDAYWAVFYNDTDATNRAIGFVDLGGPVDMSAGPLTITWSSSGLYTITRAT